MNDASPAPPESGLEAKVEHDAIFKDGDEQHDAEPGEHAKVLQDEVTQLASLVLFAVTVKHLRQLLRGGTYRTMRRLMEGYKKLHIQQHYLTS